MEGTPRAARTYYRCAARSIVPGSPVLARHPKNVYLPERPVIEQVNGWLGELFNRENRDETAQRLLNEAGALRGDAARADQVRGRIAKAETELRRLQDAIKAGANPVALVDAINGAQARLEAARAELEAMPAGRTLNQADVNAMIDYLGEMDEILDRAEPAELQDLYEALHLEMIYQPEEQAVDVSLRLKGRGSTCVRGRSCPLSLLGLALDATA